MAYKRRTTTTTTTLMMRRNGNTKRNRSGPITHLAAEELAEGGAKDLPSVRGTRVGRLARSLELYLPPLALAVDDLAQVHRCAVPQLAREVAELVPAVAVGRGLGSRQHPGTRWSG